MKERKYRLFLDYDETTSRKKDWYMYNPKHSSRSRLEMVIADVKRLQSLCPKLGKALIYRSSDRGFHVVFPDSSLTWPEVEALLIESRCHEGYKRFSLLIKDQTLRVSPKPKSRIPAPYLVKIVEAEKHV